MQDGGGAGDWGSGAVIYAIVTAGQAGWASARTGGLLAGVAGDGQGASARRGYQAMLVTGPRVAGRTGGGLRLRPEPMTQNDLALTTSDR